MYSQAIYFYSYMKLSEVLAAVIKSYAKTLQYGAQYIFQALPRLLTLWLDYSIPIPEDAKKGNSIGIVRQQTIAAINSYCHSLQKKCPTFTVSHNDQIHWFMILHCLVPDGLPAIDFSHLPCEPADLCHSGGAHHQSAAGVPAAKLVANDVRIEIQPSAARQPVQ